MKRFKKTLATIISFLMCFTLLTNVAHAEELAPVISEYVEELSSDNDVDSNLIETDIESEEVPADEEEIIITADSVSS